MAIARWLPLVCRVLVVWQLAWPALSKFALYEARVEHFRHDYSIAFPEVMVPVVGLFETAMVVAALLGIAGRLAAIPVIVIMLAAFATAGPNDGSIMVLIGCVGILLLGTGPLSVWAPEEILLGARGAGPAVPRRPWRSPLAGRPRASLPGPRPTSIGRGFRPDERVTIIDSLRPYKGRVPVRTEASED